MLNKKLLAASIAVAFSSSTFAVDFTDKDAEPTVFESSIATSQATDGVVTVDGTAAADVSAEFKAGFTIGAGTSKYLLVKLSGGVFTTDAPTLTLENGTANIASGGSEGDATVLFEVNAGADAAVEASDMLTFDAASFDLEVGESFEVSATLYETAGNAVNEVPNTQLASVSGTVAVFASSNTGVFTTQDDAEAKVALEFKAFGGDENAPVYNEELGTIDVSKIVGDVTSYTPAGDTVSFTDLVEGSQDVTIAGDFSVGTWTLSDDGCTTAVEETDSSDSELVFEDLLLHNDTDEIVYTLCVVNEDDENGKFGSFAKGEYSATLESDELTGALGNIVFDTLSVNVPYLTTFGDYNQRIYIVNSSSVDVDYSFTSFFSEEGNEAEAGDKAEGTVPAKGMIAVKATDIVSLQNQTRTSATLELDAQPAVITVTTQTVNIGGDNATDTVVLHQPSN